MAKAKEPEVIMLESGTNPDWFRKIVTEAGGTMSMEPKPGLVPVYWDRRTLPRRCGRTGMRRDFCCCAPCRSLRRRKHRASCRCWLCYADRQGEFIDDLGKRTPSGHWAIFLTLTYRTREMVKRLNATVQRPEPHPDFVHHFFDRMIAWLETELCERVEFFVVDQYGSQGGRLHQHAGITSPVLVAAAQELSKMRGADPRSTRLPERLKPFARMLFENAGLNRILPWEMDAGYYIGRYIGRDAERSHWDFRIGPEPKRTVASVGRRVIVESQSVEESSNAYRQAFRGWHR